ncbi:putative secondary metabolism biosynthetic enzyme [Metarhizium acridum]|nr:putative secondary metabolism biosynthetic enzyme [Metarhizium acridum]
MIALDCYADTSDTGGMGWELSGVVSRVGSGVSKFQPGDRICAATSPGMQTFVQVPVDMVFNIPDAMSFARSVAGLNPLMTAYHGLINLARLKKSDTILIHAAAGSTGQMAICVAQHVGARIFATVGFDEKKQLLMDEFGIPAEDIFTAAILPFKGALCGFIEIGKADIGANTSLPMAYFAKNVTFAAVDLVHMAAGDAQGVQDLTRACMAMLFETKVGQYPKPLHLFSVKDAEKAFRFIQSGKNTGRTVITLDPDDKVSKYITRKSKWRFSNQATYLLVGGLGGIGRSIMAWMVEKGARYFIAPSRSGVKSHAATDFVAQMDQKGVRVMTSRCDASSSKQLADLLLACSDMPPIKGCINAAMALHDSLFCNMTHSQWKASIQSKVASSWNLHQILPADLDFFILLSSAASIYGAIGQCNYSAACAAQDSIACHRSSKGGKAISINLGLIRDVGAMVEHQELQVSADNIRDVKAVYERDILAIMDYYCDPLTLASKETHTQVLVGGVTPADTDTVLPPHIDRRPFYSGFPRTSRPGQQRGSWGDASNETALLFQRATSLADRAAVALSAIIDKLAHALCVSSDDIDVQNHLSDYGVDSLMAVELRHWFRRDFKADVAVFDIMGSNISISNVAELVARASEKLP